MITLLPLSLCCLESYMDTKLFLFFSPIAYFSLFPLLYRVEEFPVKMCITGLHILISVIMTKHEALFNVLYRRIDFPGIRNLFSVVEEVYLYGILVIMFISSYLLPTFAPHLAFLPLMLTSVYCAVGMVYWWNLCLYQNIRIASLVESYDD